MVRIATNLFDQYKSCVCFYNSTTYTIQNNDDDYIDQFRYIQHIVIRGEGQGKFRLYIDLLDSFSTCISIS